MPPKRKAPDGAAAIAPKGNSKKVYGKAPELPEGEILTDFSKKQWNLGRSIGCGGFGRIYLASKAGEKGSNFVVKMEPATNGPLFQEIHVYQRVAKAEMLEQWKKQKGLKFLGIPPYVAAGLHSKNSTEFRFLIMPRYAADLESHRVSRPGGRLDPAFVFRLCICCLDSLEYLHYSAQYVHADVKGENLLAASGKAFTSSGGDQFFLVDYGLAKKVSDQPIYKEDPKKAHDGTLIFTSLDAHRGCAPCYRGDVEILGYNIIYWITGSVPWMKDSAEKVFEKKLAFSKNTEADIAASPLLAPFATELANFFEHAYGLAYADRPDFDQLRLYIERAAAKAKKSVRTSSTPSTSSKRASRSGRTSSPATISSPANSTISKLKGRSPARASRQQSPLARQNGASASMMVKQTPRLLEKFVDDNEDEESEADSEPASARRKSLVRSALKKTILADDTPSPLPTRASALSPRSIIPGKANMRRYDPKAAAKRRSSIMVKKKYLAPKKTTAVTAKAATKTTAASTNGATKTAAASTRATRGVKKSYRISSSSDDE